MSDSPGKDAVHDFWNEASCGEDRYLRGMSREAYEAHSKRRYELEPEICEFAKFSEARGRRVLEIGVGLGADHAEFARSGAVLTGIDLTERAIEHTRRRLDTLGYTSELGTGDAERLPFPDNTFDLVYSWVVLHHSPDTPRCIKEVFRVLKSNGVARIMVYHKYSMVGYMLWIRYALLKGRFFTPLAEIYSRFLESPGTKAYSTVEAEALFRDFTDIRISTTLSHADLLTSDVGQRHRGGVLRLAKALWPRRFIRTFMRRSGLFMCIEARKPNIT